MTLNIIMLFASLVITARIYRAIGGQSEICKEYNQYASLRARVLLLPLGPVVIILLPYVFGWLPAIIVGYLCYLPVMILARRNINIFECSGTDLTDDALAISNTAFDVSLVGVIYISVKFVFALFANNIVSIGYF